MTKARRGLVPVAHLIYITQCLGVLPGEFGGMDPLAEFWKEYDARKEK
jgi:hypothetical protein